MKPEEEPRPDIIAMLDQVQTCLENVANLLANYYKVLREKGIPDELAGQLTREYQQILFRKNPE